VAIGSNLGERTSLCAEAQRRLACLPETFVVRASALIETPPQEGAGGGPFLNGVIELETALSPEQLLAATQGIEAALGRPPDHARGRARTMDLDILLYDDRVLRRGMLEIPHPRMTGRRFVLEPLAAIAPEVRHPILGLTAAEMRDRLASAPRHAEEGRA
jgi:2-amino-4-hydroxy-6-hydroxymethyldihydropteridine diphosphokinase